MNAGWRWRAKIAQSDHAMAMLAGRSPSADENAYVAAVASRKKLEGARKQLIFKDDGSQVYIQREEGEDLGPDTSGLDGRVLAERLERGKDDEHGGPAVVEREGQVDEDLIRSALRLMVLLDDVVDVLRHN